MSKFVYLYFFVLLPTLVFSQDRNNSGVLNIDTTVQVVNSHKEVLWSYHFVKYTVSINIYLKAFDGEVIATLTPTLLEDEKILLQTSCIIRSLEDKKIIQESSTELITTFNEEILLFPIGGRDNKPTIVIVLIVSNKIEDNR